MTARQPDPALVQLLRREPRLRALLARILPCLGDGDEALALDEEITALLLAASTASPTP